MTRRFEIRRMTGDQFKAFLEETGMQHNTFARLFGIGEPALIEKWMRSEAEIPYWVYPVTCMLQECPTAIIVARQAAAEQISFDRLRPELGQFPFLENHGIV